MTESRAYVFNLETTKIELHFEKSEYDALNADHKKMLKSAFLWSNCGKCWVSRAKEPNLWRAKEVAKALGFAEEQREGERLTFAEQMEKQAEKSEARAERYEGYSDNAERRAERLQKPLDDMHGDIAFFTQPNINTSAGRAFTNRRNRMFEQYRSGFDEYRKSEYFKEKAAALRNTASQEKFKDPAYLDRRIRECKKEITKRNKNAESYEKTLEKIANGEEIKRYNGDPLTAEEVQEWYDHELELIEVAIDKQGFLENCLDELGGIKFSKDNIKVGYIVRIQRWGEAEVIGTGPVNITYKILGGGAAGFALTAAYAEIVEVIKATEQKNSCHPFKVGEQYKAVLFEDGKRVTAVYEIIKATASTVKLKRENSDEPPIIRKPKLATSPNGDVWRFWIDDCYANCCSKEAKRSEKV